MAKPSIFSKNYNNFRKKRKRRIVITIVILIIIAIALCFTLTNKSFKNSTQKNSINQNNKNVSNKDLKNQNKVQIKENKEEKENIKEKSDLININDNLKIKVFYNEEDSKRTYQKVCDSTSDGEIYFDINPSKSSILILDSKTQKIYLIDQNEKVSDISKDKYISSKGLVILRENKIENDKNYIWCTSPKFIDDNHIAFISQLPWLSGNNNKFIWYGDVQNKEYYRIQDKQGQNVEFQNLSDKGLGVTIDNTQYYLNAKGELLK